VQRYESGRYLIDPSTFLQWPFSNADINERHHKPWLLWCGPDLIAALKVADRLVIQGAAASHPERRRRG
jgi:hypothetical protein